MQFYKRKITVYKPELNPLQISTRHYNFRVLANSQVQRQVMFLPRMTILNEKKQEPEKDLVTS